MITIIATITVKPGTESEFISIFNKAVLGSRKEEGCIAYRFFQDVKNKEVFYTVEEWQNQEAIGKHKDAPHFKQASADAASLFAKAPEIKVSLEIK